MYIRWNETLEQKRKSQFPKCWSFCVDDDDDDEVDDGSSKYLVAAILFSLGRTVCVRFIFYMQEKNGIPFSLHILLLPTYTLIYKMQQKI